MIGYSFGIPLPLAYVLWGLRNITVMSDTVWQVVACAVEETGRGRGLAEWGSDRAVSVAKTGPRDNLEERRSQRGLGLWVIGLVGSGAARRPGWWEIRSEGSGDSRAWRAILRPAGPLCALRGVRSQAVCFLSLSGCFFQLTQRTPKSVLDWDQHCNCANLNALFLEPEGQASGTWAYKHGLLCWASPPRLQCCPHWSSWLHLGMNPCP